MENVTIVVDVVAGGAIGPYMPLIKTATNLIGDIMDIYNAAEYNKNICDALVERVKLANNSIDTLQRRRQKYEDKLGDDEYYKAFYRFIDVLTKIKKFAEEISNIHGFRKYTQAYKVKDKFQKLTDDYDIAMKDLHFNMAVSNEEQRRMDAEALEEDLSEMTKYLGKMDNKVNDIYDEVIYIREKIDDETLQEAVNIIYTIDSKELTFPARGKADDVRGKDPNVVIRRIYKGQEVACKSILKTEDEMKTSPEMQRHLEILMKLSDCQHILRFYGISKIENDNVMIFEWAERGNLRQLYEAKDIKWHFKVKFALGICRGLIFLQQADILHHDLKCQNILMTEGLEPKIYNFEFARYTSGSTTSLNDQMMKDSAPWLAPEKLIDFKTRYTTQCEVFSFGMLLWELAFEKLPYQSWNVEKIVNHVIKGGREKIVFRDSSIPEISKLQEKYKKIINDTWKQNPQERISFMKLLTVLEGLFDSIHFMFDDDLPGLLPDKALDLDGTRDTSDANLELPDVTVSSASVKPVISLEEGIQAFKDNKHQKAWECFDFHAKNNNTTAKYWKGRYLWEGLHDGIKEREEGKELLKEAADEGNSDAQLRYAFTLANVLDDDDNNKQIFMDYLKKAAIDGNNPTAQFNLGDIYLKGKLNIQVDENEGIKWLRKAALQNETKAISLLNQSGKSVYK